MFVVFSHDSAFCWVVALFVLLFGLLYSNCNDLTLESLRMGFALALHLCLEPLLVDFECS